MKIAFIIGIISIVIIVSRLFLIVKCFRTAKPSLDTDTVIDHTEAASAENREDQH